jgi:hypothetical protein
MNNKKKKKERKYGWEMRAKRESACWFRPVISATWEGRQKDLGARLAGRVCNALS